MKRTHYDSLRQDSQNPIILVVLMLPEAPAEWVSHTGEELIMRRCAYWENLHGRSPIADDADSTTICIPKTNLLIPIACKR